MVSNFTEQCLSFAGLNLPGNKKVI